MIKLDIISGFLGAGKTSFIKRILKAFETKAEKIVILINEFGDMGIDGDLVKRDGYDLYEITKGCLCCSLKEDFTSTLLKISKDIAPDRVILEPSGIFVVQEAIELITQNGLLDKYRINNLITIVDTMYLSQNYNSIGTFLEKQIQSASKLILSKVQFITEEEKEKIIVQLNQLNENAKIYKKPWDNYSNEEILEILDEKRSPWKYNNQIPFRTNLFKIKHNYESYSVKIEDYFDRETIIQLMEEIIEGKYGKIVRSKGILLGKPHNIEFQYTDKNYNIEIFPKFMLQSKMIFIGENIKKEKLINKILEKRGK